MTPRLAPEFQALDYFLTGTPDLLAIIDRQDRFQYLNPAWEATLGYTLDELRSLPYRDFMHPDDAKEASSGPPTGRNERFRNRYLDRDGNVVWLDWSIIFDPERHVTYAIGRNVTHHVEAEERHQRLHQQIAHELAAPLGAIRLSMDAMLEKNVITDQFYRMLDHNVTRLLRLKEDVRTLGIMETVHLPVSMVMIDLAEVATRAVDDLQPFAKEHDVALGVEAQTTVVLGDADRLEQVATNLIHNAVKFSPPGANVHVDCGTRDGMAFFSVMDDGPGFEADQVHKLFQPFSQLENVRHSSEEGSGLGLYISRKLVEAHGGTIGVEDRPRGACFTFELPLA